MRVDLSLSRPRQRSPQTDSLRPVERSRIGGRPKHPRFLRRRLMPCCRLPPSHDRKRTESGNHHRRQLRSEIYRSKKREPSHAEIISLPAPGGASASARRYPPHASSNRLPDNDTEQRPEKNRPIEASAFEGYSVD